MGWETIKPVLAQEQPIQIDVPETQDLWRDIDWKRSPERNCAPLDLSRFVDTSPDSRQMEPPAIEIAPPKTARNWKLRAAPHEGSHRAGGDASAAGSAAAGGVEAMVSKTRAGLIRSRSQEKKRKNM